MMKTRRRLALVLIPAAVLLLSAYIAFRPDAAVSQQDEPAAQATNPALQKATFAGGCFWCMEPPFEDLPGVQSVLSGYAGGEKVNPTYDEVSSGSTDYVEAVQISYNPEKIGYERLLHVFWRQINPTDDGGQFADRGSQYRTRIFYHNKRQKRLAQQSKNELAQSGRFSKPLVTKIRPFTSFYKAEKYHQDFYKKNPERYHSYKRGSGRAGYLKRVWGDEASKKQSSNYQQFEKPSDEALREQLTDRQYKITQKDGTEPAFRNKYWDNKKAGIYVDVVSGEPLFSSTNKFESGTGWPSFTKPLEPEFVVKKTDRSMGMTRTEVRSKYADSHLGHIFDDGPVPTGKRYCVNSAALRFIPTDQLDEAGYGEYTRLFEKQASLK